MIMRCEEVAAALATGGAIRRWRAMRHAGGCACCAAARDELRGVVEALREVPGLSAYERGLWEGVAGENATSATLDDGFSGGLVQGNMARESWLGLKSRIRLPWQPELAVWGGLSIRAVARRAWWYWPQLVCAAALVGVGVGLMLPPAELRRRLPVIVADQPTVVKGETLRNLEGLRGEVVALSRELEGLRRRAELLDARREVDAMIGRLAARGGASGL